MRENVHVRRGGETGAGFLMGESLYRSMARNGHDYIDVLKVDVEGGEWGVFKDLMSDEGSVLPFGQLLIELHLPLGKNQSDGAFNHTKRIDYETVFDFFSGLESRGFRIFSQELNLAPVFEGKQPVAAEFSLVHPSTYYSRKSNREQIRAQMAPHLPPRSVPPVARAINSHSA